MVRRPVTVVACLAAAVAMVACGSNESSAPDNTSAPTAPPTVAGVGVLPDTVPAPEVVAVVPEDAGDDEFGAEEDGGDVVPISVEIARPVDEDGVVLDTIAEQVQGNRVIAIGDSILTSTASRYGGEMCAGLNPLGWDVEVDAEPGRFIEFGNEVLQERLPDEPLFGQDFDAAIVHLGSNYDEDRDNYFFQLNEILFQLAPRPTILMTVSEFRPEWAEVNEVINELALLYDNVTIVDWAAVATFPGVLTGDGIHPTEQGEMILVDLLEVSMGIVSDQPGECLPTQFTDDSADRSLGGF